MNNVEENVCKYYSLYVILISVLIIGSIWWHNREGVHSEGVTASSYREQSAEAQADQSAITEGLAESRREAQSLRIEMSELRREAGDARTREQEAGEIIGEIESILSDIRQGAESKAP